MYTDLRISNIHMVIYFEVSVALFNKIKTALNPKVVAKVFKCTYKMSMYLCVGALTCKSSLLCISPYSHL
jgi:hypothetical protein